LLTSTPTSTITVLDALASRCRLRAGTVLAFDEIFGPPGTQKEELRALREVAAAHSFAWRFITYLNHPRTRFGRAAVQMKGDPACVQRSELSAGVRRSAGHRRPSGGMVADLVSGG
jgi:predicted O-methyltransferase YrrM